MPLPLLGGSCETGGVGGFASAFRGAARFLAGFPCDGVAECYDRGHRCHVQVAASSPHPSPMQRRPKDRAKMLRWAELREALAAVCLKSALGVGRHCSCWSEVDSHVTTCHWPHRTAPMRMAAPARSWACQILSVAFECLKSLTSQYRP